MDSVRLGKRTKALATALAFAGVALAAPVAAATVELTPGGSAQFGGSLAVPALPPKLDFLLLFDTTGTMTGEISNAQGGATTFFNTVSADSPDAMFAVSSFEDYPYSTFGNLAAGDQPYRRNTDLTANLPTWQVAVNSLAVRNGEDAPEAQVPALYGAATGSGLMWPTGSVAAGQGISFRDGIPHVIALVSDGPFHNDSTGADAYSFTDPPTYAQMLAALADKEVRVIAADSSGLPDEPDMVGISGATSGTHTRVNTNGTGLYEGIFNTSPGITAALYEFAYPATREISCGPLQASVESSSWASVSGSSTLPYTQTVSVPSGITVAQLPPGGTVDCVVSFFWSGLKFSEHHTDVRVVLPPETQITRGPKDKTKKQKARFAFSSPTAGATFECGLDGRAFRPCSSPHTVKVKAGKHTLEVRATANGQTDATPASDDWKVKKKKKKRK